MAPLRLDMAIVTLLPLLWGDIVRFHPAGTTSVPEYAHMSILPHEKSHGLFCFCNRVRAGF